MLRTDQVWPRTLAVYCDTGVLRIETVKERRRDVAARVVTKPISALHAEKATDFTMLARSLAQGPQKVPQVGVINDNDAAEQFIMAHSEISYNKMVYLISKESLDFRPRLRPSGKTTYSPSSMSTRRESWLWPSLSNSIRKNTERARQQDLTWSRSAITLHSCAKKPRKQSLFRRPIGR